ncbi:MAG: hypothetical protein HQK83_20345, partial [Fibrobacteria bacterium]|nr:hypothetical protein [Fibrobacteria bacterium]
DPIGYYDGMNLYTGYFVPGEVDPSGTMGSGIYDEKTGGWPTSNFNNAVANSVGWATAFGDLWVWMSGNTPAVSNYNQNSNRSVNASKSKIGSQLAKDMVATNKGKKCKEWISHSKIYNFGISAFFGDLPNGTAHFVGSAMGYGDPKYTKPCEITVKYRLENKTSLKSFLYHIIPASWNQSSGSAFGNWTQVYNWEETYECEE